MKCTLLTVLLLTSAVHSAKILSLLNVLSPSHYIFNRALIRALASRGHQVTVVSPDAGKDTGANITNIKLEGVYETIRDDFDYESLAEVSDVEMVAFLFDWVGTVCEKEFRSEGAKRLLNYPRGRQFDVIIMEADFADCFYGFIPWFGSPPVVALSPFGVSPWTAAAMGAPDNPAYMPVSMFLHVHPSTLTERMYNAFIHYYLMYKYEYQHIPRIEAMAKEFFKQDMPSFMDIQRNFSVVLVNTMFGLEDSRPLTPNIIPVGGMHVKENADPLPKDLKKYLDEAKDGFIYFSLGSNFRSDALTKDKHQALLEAFAELPQKVLWKFESDLTGLPPNVQISKWLPQTDILAHPNIRMFISHCGKMSTTESMYRGVPVIGMPFAADQQFNMQKLIRKGIAVHLDLHTLTKQSVLKAVREILDNARYMETAKKMSTLFRDQPESALERAVFWTEYVIRHDGAPHLRSAATSLYWYEYLLLDVLLTVAVVGLAVSVLIWALLRKAYFILCSPSSSKVKTN